MAVRGGAQGEERVVAQDSQSFLNLQKRRVKSCVESHVAAVPSASVDLCKLAQASIATHLDGVPAAERVT
jgi:hypothetical protein